jgi:trehalose 6-phosphate phosphatase
MLPPLNPNSALFLDIDGTLIDLAATPQAVRVPPDLPALLRHTQLILGGALAAISGRRLTDIDSLLGPGLPCAAEHGAMLRGADGVLTQKARRPDSYDRWLKILRQEIADMPGVLIEEKEVSLVVHYRQAPQFEPVLSQLVEHLIGASDDAVLLLAHCAFELKPRGGNKADALAWFMQSRPFAGRLPVFIGDDVTDEPAIQKAIEMGGIGLHVARDFAGRTQEVRDWIKA